MELNSSIYQCKVYHERRAPKENAFAYNIYMFMIDLDELDIISKRFWAISRNRFNLFSFYDNDHFRKKNSNGFKETVREKLEIYLVENGVHAYPSRIKLLTSLRILGHVFNPVSFYYCYDENDVCFAVIAEVTNTYREMKMYLLVEHDQKFFYGSKKKLFYISPFTQLDDQLELKVGFPEDILTILKKIRLKSRLC